MRAVRAGYSLTATLGEVARSSRVAGQPVAGPPYREAAAGIKQGVELAAPVGQTSFTP